MFRLTVKTEKKQVAGLQYIKELQSNEMGISEFNS